MIPHEDKDDDYDDGDDDHDDDDHDDCKCGATSGLGRKCLVSGNVTFSINTNKICMQCVGVQTKGIASIDVSIVSQRQRPMETKREESLKRQDHQTETSVRKCLRQ